MSWPVFMSFGTHCGHDLAMKAVQEKDKKSYSINYNDKNSVIFLNNRI